MSETDWEERIRHLEMHSFPGCGGNTSNYQWAANFRDHIVFHHSGIIGVWTDALEAACSQGLQRPQN